jgi:ATP-dependent Clp protease ATP-binding subunit ClpC
MVIDPIKFLWLTNSVHEGVQNSIITSWILDLSDSSEAIQDISAESLEQVVWQEKAKWVLKNILEEVISWVHIKKDWYNKPIASMIFAGPSWVWKTLLARVTQQILNNHYNNKIEIIKINCADFAWESVHWLTRLIGASAWYMGSDKKPLLHPQNVHWQGRVILFDEIEKAWPTFWNLLLSILDDGTLDINYFQKDSSKTSDKTSPVLLWASEEVSDTTSLKTIFWDSVIIMTSNVWNDTVEKELSGSWIWFWSSEKQPDEVDVEAIILQEFAKQFRIEMQWRFDYIVPFEHLTKENAKDIIDQLINRLITNTLSKGNWFVIEFSDSAKERILEEICSSKDFRKFWWRAIEWYFKKQILPYVARAINSWKFREEDTHSCLLVTEHNQKIVFSKIPIWDIESTKAKVSDIMTNS